MRGLFPEEEGSGGSEGGGSADEAPQRVTRLSQREQEELAAAVAARAHEVEVEGQRTSCRVRQRREAALQRQKMRFKLIFWGAEVWQPALQIDGFSVEPKSTWRGLMTG